MASIDVKRASLMLNGYDQWSQKVMSIKKQGGRDFRKQMEMGPAEKGSLYVDVMTPRRVLVPSSECQRRVSAAARSIQSPQACPDHRYSIPRRVSFASETKSTVMEAGRPTLAPQRVLVESPPPPPPTSATTHVLRKTPTGKLPPPPPRSARDHQGGLRQLPHLSHHSKSTPRRVSFAVGAELDNAATHDDDRTLQTQRRLAEATRNACSRNAKSQAMESTAAASLSLSDRLTSMSESAAVTGTTTLTSDRLPASYLDQLPPPPPPPPLPLTPLFSTPNKRKSFMAESQSLLQKQCCDTMVRSSMAVAAAEATTRWSHRRRRSLTDSIDFSPAEMPRRSKNMEGRGAVHTVQEDMDAVVGGPASAALMYTPLRCITNSQRNSSGGRKVVEYVSRSVGSSRFELTDCHAVATTRATVARSVSISETPPSWECEDGRERLWAMSLLSTPAKHLRDHSREDQKQLRERIKALNLTAQRVPVKLSGDGFYSAEIASDRSVKQQRKGKVVAFCSGGGGEESGRSPYPSPLASRRFRCMSSSSSEQMLGHVSLPSTRRLWPSSMMSSSSVSDRDCPSSISRRSSAPCPSSPLDAQALARRSLMGSDLACRNGGGDGVPPCRHAMGYSVRNKISDAEEERMSISPSGGCYGVVERRRIVARSLCADFRSRGAGMGDGECRTRKDGGRGVGAEREHMTADADVCETAQPGLVSREKERSEVLDGRRQSRVRTSAEKMYGGERIRGGGSPVSGERRADREEVDERQHDKDANVRRSFEESSDYGQGMGAAEKIGRRRRSPCGRWEEVEDGVLQREEEEGVAEGPASGRKKLERLLAAVATPQPQAELRRAWRAIDVAARSRHEGCRSPSIAMPNQSAGAAEETAEATADEARGSLSTSGEWMRNTGVIQALDGGDDSVSGESVRILEDLFDSICKSNRRYEQQLRDVLDKIVEEQGGRRQGGVC